MLGQADRLLGNLIGDKISPMASGKKYEVLDVGIYHPEETPTDSLLAGQVG